MRKLLFIAAFCGCFFLLSGNALAKAEPTLTLPQIEDSIVVLGATLLTDTIAENRVAAADQILALLKMGLAEPQSFDYAFEKVNSVSIQYPQKREFRIFTWQLYVAENEYKYYGLIQKNDKTNTLIELNDQAATIFGPTTRDLSDQEWYGGLVYKIKAFKGPDGPAYLLFSYNGFSLFNRQKIVDVLTFSESGARFGDQALFFETLPTNDLKRYQNRLIFEYSAETAMRCTYEEELDAIVFDFLVARASLYGQGLMNVPSGSFDGYKKTKNGYWEYEKEIVKTQVLENNQAPREMPVLESDKRDLFGKPRN